jgi:hypothetical protein
MSTRGVMGIRHNGVDKLMYNHSDSYPTGLGAELVEALSPFVNDASGLDYLRAKAAALKMVQENSKPTKAQQKELSGIAHLGVGSQSLDDWYCLLRQAQGDLLLTLEIGYGVDSSEFVKDSLFCEWAYIVNLDERTFEVYQGFQEKKHNKGRFAGKQDTDSKYYPVALKASYPLNSIPENWTELVDPAEAA